jgi:hypothetical protein
LVIVKMRSSSKATMPRCQQIAGHEHEERDHRVGAAAGRELGAADQEGEPDRELEGEGGGADERGEAR